MMHMTVREFMPKTYVLTCTYISEMSNDLIGMQQAKKVEFSQN